MRTLVSMESVSQANMLANLIHWVSQAKQEIGVDHLPFFLDTYSTSGHLTSELRTTILKLVEVVGQAPDAKHVNSASAWSRLLLELHGIVIGDGAPARPVIHAVEVDEANELQSGDGGDEDGIDLPAAFPIACGSVP